MERRPDRDSLHRHGQALARLRLADVAVLPAPDPRPLARRAAGLPLPPLGRLAARDDGVLRGLFRVRVRHRRELRPLSQHEEDSFVRSAPEHGGEFDLRGEDGADRPRRESFRWYQARADPQGQGAFRGDAGGGMTGIPYDLLMKIQQGTMAYQYRGLPLLKN